MIARRITTGAVGAGALIAALMLGSTSAHAATYDTVNEFPTDVVSTVSGDVTVTTTLNEEANYDPSASLWGYFGTNGGVDRVSFVEWTFSQPVYLLTVNYFALEPDFGDGADDQSFSTSAGLVNLALVADGGNRVSSTGELAPDQLEAGYVGNSATCTVTVAPLACSGTIELSFPEGITSFRSFNGGAVGSGFNGTGLSLAADVPDPVAPVDPVDPVDPVTPEPAVPAAVVEARLADTGATDMTVVASAGAAALLGGALLLLRTRPRRLATD